MTDVDELIKLNLPQLATRLVNDHSIASNLSSGDWLYVLQLLNTRVGSADRGVVSRHWRLLQQAYDSALDAALRAGAVQPREEVVRRVNLLVSLANRVNSVVERDELSSRARTLALRHAPLPLDEARLQASRWRSLPTTEMRDLRYLKNLFRPLESLAAQDAESEDAREVGRWLTLLPSLP